MFSAVAVVAAVPVAHLDLALEACNVVGMTASAKNVDAVPWPAWLAAAFAWPDGVNKRYQSRTSFAVNSCTFVVAAVCLGEAGPLSMDTSSESEWMSGSSFVVLLPVVPSVIVEKNFLAI